LVGGTAGGTFSDTVVRNSTQLLKIQKSSESLLNINYKNEYNLPLPLNHIHFVQLCNQTVR